MAICPRSLEGDQERWGCSARPWPRTSGNGARPNVTTATYHNWPNTYAAGTRPPIPIRIEAYQLQILRQKSESCGDWVPLNGLARRRVFASSGSSGDSAQLASRRVFASAGGTQWPGKPATRRKQMRECLSGRVVDVRSDVCRFTTS